MIKLDSFINTIVSFYMEGIQYNET